MQIDPSRLFEWFSKSDINALARRAHRMALCSALVYVALAALWVVLSGEMVARVTRDGALQLQLYQAKGLVLVALTTVLVYAAALWAARRLGGREQLLRQRELQLSGIVETTMDAIITVDASHRIVVFNRAASEVFRLPAEEAIGQSLDRFVPARMQQAHRDHVRSFADTGKTTRRMGRLHSLVGLRADGEEFPMEASISRLGEGDAVLMTVVLRDATEQHEAEKARQAQAAAEAASLAKTQFLARMSHELRTPLNAVLGFSQLLLTARPGDTLGETQLRQLELIRDAGWHLLSLVNDVLDVSRIESGTLRVDCRAVELHPLLEEAWQLTDEQSQQHGVVLHAAYRAAAPAAAWCDPLRLRQVLLNVLSNAVKYNRPGGYVRLEMLVEKSRVRLRFVDSGLGMTHEQLSHLFEPFNRLGRERGGVEGTGIGLALTRQLVQMMDGELLVESTPGEGTRVDVLLTRCEVPAQAWTPPPPPPVAEPAANDARPLPTVLYIEDNPVNMLLVEQMLQRWPIAKLVQASDAALGLAQARRLQPQLILLDMRLPDMNGMEVLRALRGDPATATLPVVALSASAMPGDVDEALRAGAVAYWTKPLRFEQFLQDMRGLLERRSAAV